MPVIRLAFPADALSLPTIEAAAGEAFRSIGMPEIADDPLPDVQQLPGHASDGRVWVATAVERDGSAHLEQVSVHPDHAGQRSGADLVDAVASWARDRGDERLTLTTFADVPWNAPYYRKLGFHPLPDEALGPQLAAELSEERARFAAPRLAMACGSGQAHL